MKKIKGSTVCIAVMYIGWIVYIIAQVLLYWQFKVFLPMEITYGTAALFIVETVSLARLKMAKEGENVKPKKTNTILSKLGITDMPDLEDEVQEQVKKNQEEKPEC